MKNLKIYLFITILLISLFSITGCTIVPNESGDQVVFGGSYNLEKNQNLVGNLLIVGGSGSLDEGSNVTGDIVMLGGSLVVDGSVRGSISAAGGSVRLADHAVVNGDINLGGAAYSKSDSARVIGQVNQNTFNGFRIPNYQTYPQPVVRVNYQPITTILWALLQAFALAVLAVLLALFIPRPIERVAQTITSAPILSAGLGILTVIVAPALLILLALTILGIPLTLIGFLVLGLATLLGWVALGLEFGRRMAALFKSEWALPLATGLGTLILTLAARLIWEIPCVGWIIPVFATFAGLGGVFLSRFGTQVYASGSVLPAASSTSVYPSTYSPGSEPKSGSENDQPKQPPTTG